MDSSGGVKGKGVSSAGSMLRTVTLLGWEKVQALKWVSQNQSRLLGWIPSGTSVLSVIREEPLEARDGVESKEMSSVGSMLSTVTLLGWEKVQALKWALWDQLRLLGWIPSGMSVLLVTREDPLEAV